MKIYNLAVVGGGAAGFFGALAAKQKDVNADVAILERTFSLLSKVRVSGGGRCNVTHACFDPAQLSKNYPRGGKELLGPFHRFGPKDINHWFSERGIELKAEKDGRMFPITDSSQTIIDCLIKEAKRLGIEIHLGQKIQEIKRGEVFQIILEDGSSLLAKNILLATGSSSQGHNIAKALGHFISSPVPSLFSFNVPSSPLNELAGITVENAAVRLEGFNHLQSGALLITHWGFSGPAPLKLSSWAARFLQEKNYRVNVFIDWLPSTHIQELAAHLRNMRKLSPAQNLQKISPAKETSPLPKNLWKKLIGIAEINSEKRMGDISNHEIDQLTNILKNSAFKVEGKTTNKEEFVTCGGVLLEEINFKRMESKICPGLFFAGEVLDIDAVTGGFNFQNAWTTGYIAGISAQ